jgi:hypothetical protein
MLVSLSSITLPSLRPRPRILRLRLTALLLARLIPCLNLLNPQHLQLQQLLRPRSPSLTLSRRSMPLTSRHLRLRQRGSSPSCPLLLRQPRLHQCLHPSRRLNLRRLLRLRLFHLPLRASSTRSRKGPIHLRPRQTPASSRAVRREEPRRRGKESLTCRTKLERLSETLLARGEFTVDIR